MITEAYLSVLRKIAARLQDQPVQWVVTGSLGLNLRGLCVDIHDIDLQTDREGAFTIQHIFATETLVPVGFVESARIRSYLGKFMVDGIKVDVMGDVEKLLEDGSGWDEAPQINIIRRWVEIGGLHVPVLPLEYEYTAYLRMGRLEKAEMLRTWLENHPSS